MNLYKKWQMQCLAKKAVYILENKHYDSIYAENIDEARNIVLNLIPQRASIALGGSETINER